MPLIIKDKKTLIDKVELATEELTKEQLTRELFIIKAKVEQLEKDIKSTRKE